MIHQDVRIMYAIQITNIYGMQVNKADWFGFLSDGDSLNFFAYWIAPEC